LRSRHPVGEGDGNRQAKPFEALISDIGLPDGSGLDIAREIKALTPEIKAIALSGYGTEVDILKSNHAGFNTHLTKPISFEELRRALAS
jgi:CheY-like chemotaxis protein